jgi:G3E family GTPase
VIPLVLLVGFLGAGKTRFLSDLIPALQGQGLRPRIILNDFANASIDASRLAVLDALVTPLNGECVCCGSLRELMDLLYSTAGEPGDVMLIEANGATESDELLGYLTMDQRLAHFTLPLQVTVIDATRWQRRWLNNTLEAEQTRTATHLMLNWTEKLSPAKLGTVIARIGEVNSRATRTTAPQFAEALGAIARESRGGRRGVVHPAAEARAADAGDVHVHGEEPSSPSLRHRHPFASATMPLPTVVDRAAFLEFVRQLPDAIVRAKGMVRFADRDQEMFVWNRIGGRKNVLLDVSRPHASAQPVALFIGVDLPVEALSVAIGGLGTP